MSAHHSHDGVFGVVLGVVGYIVGHLFNVFPSVEEFTTAIILVAASALTGLLIGSAYRYLVKKISG